MKLTAGERRVLQRLVDEPDEELTQALPGGWWLDLDQVDGRIGWSLLRKVLIRCSYNDNRGKYFAYQANEDARKLLKDPNYETQMERHYRGEKN